MQQWVGSMPVDVVFWVEGVRLDAFPVCRMQQTGCFVNEAYVWHHRHGFNRPCKAKRHGSNMRGGLSEQTSLSTGMKFVWDGSWQQLSHIYLIPGRICTTEPSLAALPTFQNTLENTNARTHMHTRTQIPTCLLPCSPAPHTHMQTSRCQRRPL